MTATIDPQSLVLNTPPKGFHDELMGTSFFDAKSFPSITFTSTKVDITGANTAKVTGDLTLHGVTKPVTLDATFNGGYPAWTSIRTPASASRWLVRSSAPTSAWASAFPRPARTWASGDDVSFQIETEMSGPPFVKKAENPIGPNVKFNRRKPPCN